MDTLITYDEALALVANPPTLAPRPNFTNLRALRRHLQRALQRLVNPQTNVLGWSGLVMSRPMYQMLSTSPFRLPNDPGPQAVYYGARIPILDSSGNPEFDASGNPKYVPVPALDRATQASIDANFLRERNYWLSYKNIKRACYNVLDETIDDAFKFSPDPNLTGWNPSMEIIDIMEQMTTTYGRPTPTALLQNDTLFRSPYSPIDAPEVLFRRIEDCQEIMTLGDDPYTPMQLLNNAIRLLLGCGLYQRDFEEWDRKIAADKIWINLKPFIQEAFQRRLNATSNTSGQHGYVQNAFAVLEESDDDEDADVATVITQMAALTTQSQLTAASTAATTSSVTAAINQLNSNQQTMMQQMATYANANTARNLPAAHNPPLTHFNIPTIGTFQPGGNAQGGRRPGRGRGGRAQGISSPGGRRAPRTPFANFFGAPRRNGCDHRASFCPGSTGSRHGRTKHGPYVLQHRQKIRQHERVFLVRF
jgi:hypothetical protein